MHVKRIFLLEKGKCSYESVVEMPDLVLVLLLTYFYTFVLVCILVNYSWMGSQAVYLYRSQPTWNLSFQIMVCYVKLFIYEEVVSKIQLLEYLSLSVFFFSSFLWHSTTPSESSKGSHMMAPVYCRSCRVCHQKRLEARGSRGCGCLWVQQRQDLSPGLDPWLPDILHWDTELIQTGIQHQSIKSQYLTLAH